MIELGQEIVSAAIRRKRLINRLRNNRTYNISKRRALSSAAWTSGLPEANIARVPVKRLQCIVINTATEPSITMIGSVWNSKYLAETWRISSAVRSTTAVRYDRFKNQTTVYSLYTFPIALARA